MPTPWSIDDARNDSIISARGGFPFLFFFGITWILSAAISFFVAPEIAAWVCLLQGALAMPLALLLPKVLRYPAPAPDNPLTPLALQLVFIQPVAFPAFILVLNLRPEYVPAAFAAVVGAHFLPFSWMHRTNIYNILGVLVSAGAFALVIGLGLRSMHYVGFFVGSALLIGSWFVRAHALAVERG